MIFLDRAKETTTTTGSSDLVLAGAEPGYQALPISGAAGFYYCVAHKSADEWEVGIGNASSGSLVRNTILDGSSGAGVAVSFSAGTKDVFCVAPAAFLSAINDGAPETEENSDTTSGATPASIVLPSGGDNCGIISWASKYIVHATNGTDTKLWDGYFKVSGTALVYSTKAELQASAGATAWDFSISYDNGVVFDVVADSGAGSVDWQIDAASIHNLVPSGC